MIVIRGSFLFFITLLFSSSLFAGKIKKLETARGTQQFFYVIKSPKATATLILFVGGKGKLLLNKKGTRKLYNSNNFLARSRILFKRQKFNVIMFDAPTDHQGPMGMAFGFRATAEHARDIALVVDYARKKFGKPVWLVGTSRGTESVANAAIRLRSKKTYIDGIILTATITEENRKGTAVPEMKVKKVMVPVQIISHEKDDCHITPPLGSENLLDDFKNSVRTEMKLVSGGKRPVSTPCKARSYHGFYGIEKKVVALIRQFIKN